MPRMPTAEDLGRVRLQSRDVISGPRDAIGPAVAGVGQEVSRVAKARREENEALDLVRATADWNTRILNERAQYDYGVDQNYGTWGKRFDAAAPRHADAASSLIRDPVLRQKFRIQTDDDITRHSLSVADAARTLDRGKRSAEAVAGIDANLRAATMPGVDDKSSERIIRDITASITKLTDVGVFTPEQELEVRAKVLKNYTNIKAGRLVQEDPETALRHLTGAANEVYYSKLDRKEGRGKNMTEGATAEGKYQFTKGTWAIVMKDHPELGLTADGRTDRYQPERAVRAFTQDNMKILKAAGMPVSEKTLRLAHFFGAEGAIKALKAPPGADAATLFTGPAKFNPKVFYNEDGSSRTIAEVIANQTAGFTGEAGPAPGFYEFLDPTDRLQLTAQAEAEAARRFKEATDRNSLEMFHVKQRVENDLSQIEANGTPTDLTAQEVADTLGDDDAAKWAGKRVTAARTYEAVSALDTLPDAQIEEHLDSLEPKAGTDNFAEAQKVYDATEKKARKLQDLRYKDPAASVEDSPLVRQAMEKYNPEVPATVQALVSARLAAQDAVEIHPSIQQPITRREARAIITPIASIIDRMDAAILAATIEGKGDRSARRAAATLVKGEAEAEAKKLIDAIETTYGPHADKVFTFAVSEYVNDRTVGEVVSNTLLMAAKTGRVSKVNAQSIDAAKETAEATKAMAGELPAPQPTPVAPQPRGKGGTPATQHKPQTPIPTRPAIEMLIKYPQHAGRFDEIYGPGAAEQALRRQP